MRTIHLNYSLDILVERMSENLAACFSVDGKSMTPTECCNYLTALKLEGKKYISPTCPNPAEDGQCGCLYHPIPPQE